MLGELGATEVGEPAEHVTQAWSTVWKIDTDIGRFWFKENCTPHRAEGDVQSAVARLAPSYVDEPVGVDGDRGWLLTRDGGVTLMDAAPGGSRGIEGEALVRLLEDYGRMQRMTVGRWKDFHSAGLRVALPRDAAEMSRRQVEWMTSTAEDDPRQLTAEQRQAVLDAAPALEEAGDVLADGESLWLWTTAISSLATFFCPGRSRSRTASSTSPKRFGLIPSARW